MTSPFVMMDWHSAGQIPPGYVFLGNLLLDEDESALCDEGTIAIIDLIVSNPDAMEVDACGGLMSPCFPVKSAVNFLCVGLRERERERERKKRMPWLETIIAMMTAMRTTTTTKVVVVYRDRLC